MKTTWRSVRPGGEVRERSSHIKSERSAYNGSCVEVSVDNGNHVTVGDSKFPNQPNQTFRTVTWALLLGDIMRGNLTAEELATFDEVPVFYSTRPDRNSGIMVQSRIATDEDGRDHTIVQLGSYIKRRDGELYAPDGLLEFTFDEWRAFHGGVMDGEFDDTLGNAGDIAERVQNGAIDLGHIVVRNEMLLAA